jgi:PleD family two-component response regulator
MPDEKFQLLVVEDDMGMADLLTSYFREQGYEVLTAIWGMDAVRITQETPLDLVILDIRLPDIDGYEVCKQIRANRRTAHLPVIFLTEKRERSDKLAGLELGVVDYITKPFDLQELRLRVRNTLNRLKVAHSINPVTQAADVSLTHGYLSDLLKRGEGWAILSVRLAGLDAFRERYGFVAGDEVMRAVTLMINNTVRDYTEGERSFIGHFTAQDFLIITDPSKIERIQSNIQSRLEQSLPYFYPLQDRDQLATWPESERLQVVIGLTKPGDESFVDVDGLKRAILKTREPLKLN